MLEFLSPYLWDCADSLKKCLLLQGHKNTFIYYFLKYLVTYTLVFKVLEWFLFWSRKISISIPFLESFLLWQNICNIKFTISAIFSLQFRSTDNSDIAAWPSPPCTPRTSLLSQTETLPHETITPAFLFSPQNFQNSISFFTLAHHSWFETSGLQDCKSIYFVVLSY